jgi:hypothetical protein
MHLTIEACDERGGFDYMADFLANIFGNILNIVVFISHVIIVLFRNAILLAFVLSFFYGLFKLCQYGWVNLRRRGVRREESESAPEDGPKNGGA